MSDSRPVRSRWLPGVAVLLAVVLAGCGADEDGPSASASPSEQASESPAASPSEPASTSPSKKSTSPSPTKSASEPAGPVLDVRVTGGEVSPLAERVDLATGDTLVVRVQSDRAGEFHVHSDAEQYLAFDEGAVELEVTFENPGSVDIEEHESGALVARVLVR